MTDPIRGRRRDDRLWVRCSCLLLAFAGVAAGLLWFINRQAVQAGAASLLIQLPGTLGTVWSCVYLAGGIAVIGGYLFRNVETEALGLWVCATALLVNAGAIIATREVACLYTAPALLACVAILMARVEYLRTVAGRPPSSTTTGIDPGALALLPLPLAVLGDYGPIAVLIFGAGGSLGLREWLLIRAERRSKDSNSFESLTTGQHTVITDLRDELARVKADRDAQVAALTAKADAHEARAKVLNDALKACRVAYAEATKRPLP